ncbi:hypothetical protein PIB30_084735 [Stylosanthes scabra]|uniref:Uncharacterized protein n=1 Tax=Stylosanthes scabra TaxID=79078 RepID=A0ABU6WSL1_9FABA|nr:hypothetical protein [Stylosanthes scabra]
MRESSNYESTEERVRVTEREGVSVAATSPIRHRRRRVAEPPSPSKATTTFTFRLLFAAVNGRSFHVPCRRGEGENEREEVSSGAVTSTQPWPLSLALPLFVPLSSHMAIGTAALFCRSFATTAVEMWLPELLSRFHILYKPHVGLTVIATKVRRVGVVVDDCCGLGAYGAMELTVIGVSLGLRIR